MDNNPRFAKVLAVFVSMVFFSSMMAGIVSDGIIELYEPINEEDMANVPTATGTRSPAQTTRSVLVELVTGTWCPPCQGGEGALATLANEYPLTELSILEYHVSDPYAVPGNDARQSYYGITGVPTAVFDGINKVVGGSTNPDDPGVYNNYKNQIEARLPVPSYVTITVTGGISGGTGSVTANITAIDDIPPGLTNLKARFVVYEDHNYTVYVSGREYRLRYTAVEHLSTESISLSMYDNIEFTKTFSIDPSWDTDLLGVVCFVQADSTKEVLQATSCNITAGSIKSDLAITPPDITFSDPTPNENQIVTIYATVHNKGTATTSSDVLVRFFDGDPSVGGTQIGTEQNIGVLSSGGSATAQVDWSTTGEAGDHEIVVVADYPDNILEIENENNNKAPKFINVMPGPPPEVDYIVIRTASNGGGINLCDLGNYPNYPVGHMTTYWAAGYNNSLGFVFDLDSSWISSDDTIVAVTPSGTSSTITCSSINDGTITLTVIDSTYGKTNTTDITVIPPTVDYIQIVDAPGGAGSEVTTGTYIAFDTDTFYAAGFNITSGYVSDVSVDWDSDDPSVGDVSPATGTSTVFTAQQISLDDTCSVTATFGGLTDSTGLLTVLGPRIDDIRIRSAPGDGGFIITIDTYSVWETDTFYAAAYNDSFGYLDDVSVTWSSNAPSIGDVSPITGTSTTFTAQQIGSDNTCIVSVTNGVVGNSTGLLTVLAPRIDEIMIMDAVGGAGSEVTTPTYAIWATDDFFAAAFNNTVSYLYDVQADWESNDTLVGIVNPTTNSIATEFTAQEVPTNSICVVTATYGSHVDSTGIITVISSTIDEIRIRDAPGGAGNVVTTATFSVLDTDDFYAAAYNDTTDYIGDVDAVWSCDLPLVGDVSPSSGIKTTFTALRIPSDTTCMVTADYQGKSDTTGLLTVLAPTIDRIEIVDAADNAGSTVTTGTYSVYDTDDFHAAAFNDTVDYLYDVSVDWQSDDENTGVLSTATGTSTMFTAQEVATDSTCTVTATYGIHSDSTGLLTVLAPRIDYIQIRDAPEEAGSIVDTETFSVWEYHKYYVSSYNHTIGYMENVLADWESDDPEIGTVTTPYYFTNFSAQWIENDSTCTVKAIYNGHENTTGLLTVLAPRIDFIRIEDAAGGAGSEINTETYCVEDTDEFYAAAYNNTVMYLYDVEADWESSGETIGTVDALGTNTTFTALRIAKTSTIIVNATFGSHKDSTGLLTVLAPTVNEIRIRNEAGGSGVEIADVTYGILVSDQFYAAAYNNTVGYLYEVPAQWSSDATDVGDVSPVSGLTTTFTAKDIAEDGTCTVTATYSIFSDSTGLITVITSTVDEIRIMDAPGGTGNVITTATFMAGETITLYAAGFNDSKGYLGDLQVIWSSDNEGVGSVDSNGTFTAQIVVGDSTCTIFAILDGVTGSTGLLMVLSPTIDEIRIMDAADGQGNEITTATFEDGETDTFYAAAFNDTGGYIFDVSVTWTVDPGTAGSVSPEGISTTFTAGTLKEPATCVVTASYQGLSGSTGILTINALVDDIGPEKPDRPDKEAIDEDSIEFSWTPNTDEDLKEYVIQRAESPTGPWKDVKTVDSDTTSYRDKRLDPGTTYYYRVVAYDEEGNPSEPSEVMKAETLEPVSFFEEFLWLFLILVIVVVIIIAAAIASRRKRKQPPVKTQAVQPAPKKKPLPPPPKRAAQPQKVVPMVPETEKTEMPPPEKEELPPPPPPAEEMPPPPPPPE